VDLLKVSGSPSVQINKPNEDETKETGDMQDIQLPTGEPEGRKRTLTQKGFEYQLPFKVFLEAKVTFLFCQNFLSAGR